MKIPSNADIPKEKLTHLKPELFQEVVLVRDVESEHLESGDLAMLVDYVTHPQGLQDGAVLEIFNALGESIGVAVVPLSAISPLTANLLPTVRRLAA